MKKSAIFKLLMIIITISALLMLFACDKGDESETTATSANGTESNTETESIGAPGSETESNVPDESESESESESDDTPTCEHPYDAKPEGHWKPACDVCGKKEGKVQDHEYVEYQEDEGDLIFYSYVCEVCGYLGYGQEVPYEINLFFPASEIANSSATSPIEGIYNFVSGIGFGSFTRPVENAGANATVTIEDAGSIEDDPSGQYMAVRLRLPRSQTGITINLKSVHANEKFSYKINGLKPGWITIAIDLSKFQKNAATGGVMGFMGDPDDEYYLESISFTTYIGSGESLDISYVVFCEEKEDLDNFIKNDSNCYYYEDVLNKAPEHINFLNCEHNYIIDEENGTHTLEEPCFICGTSEVYDEAHTFVEVIGGGRNSYECAVCGYAKYLKLVPESVNKYVSASELNAGGIIYYPYSQFNHGLYIEPGDAYTRYEGPTGMNGDKYFNVGQVIFARDDNDVNPDNNGNAENGIRINVGDATYMVLRVRVNTDGLNPLNITLSTTEFNKTLDASGKMTAAGTFKFSVPVSQSPKDTWQVYVIDLSKVFAGKYVANADGDYVLDTFYFNICEGNFAPGCALDISYMAYCSSWEEVAAIVDEEQLFYLSDSVGGGNWANTESRKCSGECTLGDADIINDSANGTITYQFKCSVCGNAVTSKTVDESVARYYYAGELASSAKTYFQINNGGGGKPGQIIYDSETGRVYSRYTGYEQNGAPVTGQVIWQRAQADMWAGQTSSSAEHYTESVGNAEWLVMRIKTNNPEQKFYFDFSTTEYNTVDANALGRLNGMLEITVPLSASNADEWTTYVMNLKDVFAEEYIKDSETGEYVIDTFYFSFPAMAVTTNIDIEYFAFVEGSWAELDALVDEQNVVVISDKSGGHGLADVVTGKCVEGKHAYGYSSTANADGSMTNAVACAVCGDVKREQNISADINKFFDITSIGCFYQVHATVPGNSHSNAVVQGQSIDAESGDVFVRVAATFGNTHINLNGGNAGGALSTYTIDTGRYAVLKFRADGRGFAFDAQTGDYGSHTNSVYSPTEEDEGKWLIFVIDLAALESVEGTKGYTTDSEQTVKFRLTTSGSSRDEDGWYIEDPYYVDIAYFAIVDTVDEAEELIGNDSYRLYENGLHEAYEEKNVADASEAQ